MKKINKSVCIFATVLLFASFVVGSCGKMDDTYREFLADGETVYVAKADSLKVRPGRERVELEWLVMSDPKVKRYKVYWNNRADSIERDLNKVRDGDTVRFVIDNLPGGVYEFEVFQFGNVGESSVRSVAIGRAYDDNYEAYLPNRIVESAETTENGETTIRWSKYSNPDMIGIDFSYISSLDKPVNIVIPPNELETTLLNLKSQSEVKYRTMFKPDTTAIDTFYSDYSGIIPTEDVTANYLNNYRVPFARLDDWDGSRWGIVADWVVSESAKIQTCKDGKCYGSWDGHKSARENTMSVQKLKNEPAAPNGKIFQTVTLPKGEYELVVNLVPSLNNGGTNLRYIVVNAGAGLPNTADVNTALAYKSFVGAATKQVSSNFTLTSASEISIGILFHFVDADQLFNVESFKLKKKLVVL